MKIIRKISLFALFLSLVILPSYAFAQLITIQNTAGRLGAVGEIACATYFCLTNNGLFSLIATMAIFFLGIGAFFGRIMWGTVLVTTLAVVLIVGASNIATTLVGTANKCQWAFGSDVCPVTVGGGGGGGGCTAITTQCNADCSSVFSGNPAKIATCIDMCLAENGC